MIFLENEKLLALRTRLNEAQSLIDSVDIKINILQNEVTKAKNGYTDYSRNLGRIVLSFLSIHKSRHKEAKTRYYAALSEKTKIMKSVDRICQELRQYAIDYCVPFQYREAAVVEYNQFDNFVTISYYVDEELKELVALRLYINDSVL